MSNVSIMLLEKGQPPLGARLELPSKLSPDYAEMTEGTYVGIRVDGGGADSGITIPMHVLTYLMQKVTEAAAKRAGTPLGINTQ